MRYIYKYIERERNRGERERRLHIVRDTEKGRDKYREIRYIERERDREGESKPERESNRE